MGSSLLLTFMSFNTSLLVTLAESCSEVQLTVPLFPEVELFVPLAAEELELVVSLLNC